MRVVVVNWKIGNANNIDLPGGLTNNTQANGMNTSIAMRPATFFNLG